MYGYVAKKVTSLYACSIQANILVGYFCCFMPYLKTRMIYLLFCVAFITSPKDAHSLQKAGGLDIVLDEAGDRSVEVFTQNVLERAYKELGITIRYNAVPLARSYREANSGRLDGLRGRVGTVVDSYPNLIKVDVPLVTFNVILIVDKEDCRSVTSDPEQECDINQLSRVGTVRGFKALQDYRERNPLPFDVLELVSKEQTLEMLAADKLQAAILTESLIPEELFEQHPSWSSYLLTSVSLYHYLHNKHEELARDIAQVLSGLESSGWLEEQRRFHRLRVKSLAKSIP
jgi:hypothetical protein